MKDKINFSLPKGFDLKKAEKLLAQIVRVFEDRTHFGLNKVKTRSEVNRTKKKLYKQKGTGGARHGARSAPIFVGGGKAHGPKGVKRELKMPLKMKKKALSLALAIKFDRKEAVLIENIEKIKKTKDAVKKITELKLKGQTLVVLAEKNKELSRFFKNIKNTKALMFNNLNAYEVIRFKNILVDSLVSKDKKESNKK